MLAPVSCGMEDADDLYELVRLFPDDAIDDDVGKTCDHELARSRLTPYPCRTWECGEPSNCKSDSVNHPARRRGAVIADVMRDIFQVGTSRPEKGDSHRVRRLKVSSTSASEA